jgi:cell division FtsZ-interacting protein ZapD
VILKYRKSHPAVEKRLKETASQKKRKNLKRQLKMKNERQTFNLTNWIARIGVLDPKKKENLMKTVLEWILATDKPLSEVESPFFRKIMFTTEQNLILPYQTSFSSALDEAAVKARIELKKEIVKDVEDTHKTIHTITDHGTSNDRFCTKKNAVSVAWATKNFTIKRATIDLYNCQGS